MCRANCKYWFHFTTSIIGILLGIAAFIAFFCIYKNYHAGTWGLVSSLLAAVCCHLHHLHLSHRLPLWHSPETLRNFHVLGFLGSLAGLAGLVWYLFIASYKHIPVLPVDGSCYIAAIWAFMTFLWGLLLIHISQAYQRDIIGDRQPLRDV